MNEVSIHLSARSVEGVRAVVEKCLEIAEAGELIPEGRIVTATGPDDWASSRAMLYTFPSRLEAP